jgi:hypothetical protein
MFGHQLENGSRLAIAVSDRSKRIFKFHELLLAY